MNDAWHENQMLSSELQSLRTRVKALSETVEALTAKNVLLLAEKAAGQWISSAGGNPEVMSLVQGYVQEIEELRARLLEAEAMYQQLKKRQLQVYTAPQINIICLPSFGTKCNSLMRFKPVQVNAANPYGDSGYIFHSDSTSLLSDAKKELQKEIDALTALKEQQASTTNSSIKTGDDGEGDDTEIGQDSASEDDSDDDSDRKGIFKHPLVN